MLSALFPSTPRLILSGEKQTVTKPIVVRFSLPPSRHNIRLAVDPNVPVSIGWSGGFFGHLSRTMIITPQTNWDIDKVYNLQFSNIVGVVGFGKKIESVKEVQTQKLPDIKLTSVSGVKDVSPEEPVTIELTQPPQNIADFFFELTPAADFSTEISNNTYTLTFTEPLEQGKKYTLTIWRQVLIYDVESDQVERRLKKQIIAKEVFTTRAPALVKSYSPQGSSVLPNQQNLTVLFSETMDRQSVIDRLTFSPKNIGRWSWTDSQTLNYIFSNDLAIDTKYVATIEQGARAVSGSFIDEKESLSFKTVGNLKVTSSSPYQYQTAVGLGDNIIIKFDQPVNKSQLLDNLTISPAIEFSTSWSGNSLVVNPNKSFDYSRSYTLGIIAGVKTIYGKPLANNYSLTFTTELKRVVLNIPIDYQDRALSCEAAALKMALNYRGINVSELDIMSVVGYDTTIKSGNTWGDPDVAFVGNIDGSQNSTGYGVHWGPIARAAKSWRNAKAFSGGSVSQLAGELESGNPVIIWGVLGNAYKDPWYTPAHRYIAAWKGEHARTVIGYIGSPSNPASFIINDPIVGRIVWSAATLKSNWSTFNNSGVVIY